MYSIIPARDPRTPTPQIILGKGSAAIKHYKLSSHELREREHSNHKPALKEVSVYALRELRTPCSFPERSIRATPRYLPAAAPSKTRFLSGNCSLIHGRTITLRSLTQKQQLRKPIRTICNLTMRCLQPGRRTKIRLLTRFECDFNLLYRSSLISTALN